MNKKSGAKPKAPTKAMLFMEKKIKSKKKWFMSHTIGLRFALPKVMALYG
jgi:hypothetical protein